MADVAEFVRRDVIEDREGGHHEFPIQANDVIGRAASPPGLGLGDDELFIVYAELFRPEIEPLLKLFARALLDPQKNFKPDFLAQVFGRQPLLLHVHAQEARRDALGELREIARGICRRKA